MSIPPSLFSAYEVKKNFIGYDNLAFSEYKNVIFSDYNLRYDYFSGRKARIWRSDSVAIFRSAKTITLQGSDVIT